MDRQNFLGLLKNASAIARSAQQSAANLTIPESAEDTPPEANPKSYYLDKAILAALHDVSEALALSYIQIVSDFEDEKRVSWAGTAHEIRELLRNILEKLAPTELVKIESWFKQDPNTSGPTQKQRVHYILSTRGGDSKQQKVVQDIEIINDKIGELVRDVYGRASDAAHRSKSKSEALKFCDILKHSHMTY